MPIQNVYMNQGTWIFENDSTIPHGSDSYMMAGVMNTGKCRPLINFNNDGFSGQILGGSLFVYCSNPNGYPWIWGYRVTRDYYHNATWSIPWTTPGCDHVWADRSDIRLFTSTRAKSGWIEMPVADLTELLNVINGKDTILLVGGDAPAARIEKSPAPYLAIEYRSSLVGGVQII